MERLSLLDSEFLYAEDASSPLHIAGICMFEGPAPSPEEFTRLLESKLDRVPRYRQRVRELPLELGRPVWVDDPHFDLGYHVRREALPAPGRDPELCTLIGRIMSQCLDRERPLWEAWVIEGLEGGLWALVSKVHHCMVDGISGMDLLAALLDVDRDAELEPAKPWTPSPPPTETAMVRDAFSGFAADAAQWAKKLREIVRHPVEASSSVAATGGGIRDFLRSLEPKESYSLVGSVGPHRRYAHGNVGLDEVRTIRKGLGGTVNDVVLAAITGGYRALLSHRGEIAKDGTLRSLVPVSVRRPDERGVPKNRVSATLCELPIHVDDPRERLAAVRESMGTLKDSHMVDSAEWVTEIGNLAPPMVAFSLTRLAARALHRIPQRSVHTVTTNIPGPSFALYCLGRKMVALYPYVPITQGLRTGIAVVSYDGRVYFGVTADYDSVPDVDFLATAIELEFKALRDLAAKALATSAHA